MRHHFIASIVLLLVSLTPASSTRAADSAPIPADAQPRWWKGNLHAHTLWSDGDDFPEMVAEWYREKGYHFLALSDHNVLSQGQRWMPLVNVERRGGKAAMEKYLARFGRAWVETRGQGGEGSPREVRLKPLGEFRHLLEERGRFLLIQSEEISDRFEQSPIHVNVANVLEAIAPQQGRSVSETIENNFRAALAQAARTGQPVLPHLNHPNFQWAVTAEDLAHAVSDHFFEVFNGHPLVNQLGDAEHPSIEKMWDIANALRMRKLTAPPLFGLATDDSHHYHAPGMQRSTSGRGWVMVRAAHLTPESLIGAMRAGDFYATTGVVLRDVRFDAQARELSIDIEPDGDATFTTRFVGTPKGADVTGRPVPTTQRVTQRYSDDVGKTLATAEGLKPTCKLTGDELYVRAVITSSRGHENSSYPGQKKQAWTQPVGWDKTAAPTTPAPAAAASGDSGAAASQSAARNPGAATVSGATAAVAAATADSPPAIAATRSAGDWQADPAVVARLSHSRPGVLYEEAKVPAYTLPDVLTSRDGSKVATRQQWPQRRAELMELFRSQMYGRRPDKPQDLKFDVLAEDRNALGGAATRRHVSIRVARDGKEHAFDLLTFTPNAMKEPAPFFLFIDNRWRVTTRPAKEVETSGFWPVKQIIARGYGTAAFYTGDVAPDDKDRFREGVIRLYENHATAGGSGGGAGGGGESGGGGLGGAGATTRPAPARDAWAAVAAWGWGASRALDYLETDPKVDAKRVAIVGHSRGGKAALWAAAEDERFAAVFPNAAGCGGPAIARRRFGERIGMINARFPHWFCDNFKRYDDREDDLPFDQHALVALVAPRAVYMAGGSQDLWLDPRGCYLALAAASPVYGLFDQPPVSESTMPDTGEQLIVGNRGYHMRAGGHDLTAFDWAKFTDFTDTLWPRRQ